MATWQEIGIDNFRTARILYDSPNPDYRSATSRFYYAAFAILTHELIQCNAAADFREGRATPGHSQLPGLIETHFTHFGSERTANLVWYVRNLYRDRIDADYSLLRVDRQSGTKSYRAAAKVFQYLGVSHERKSGA